MCTPLRLRPRYTAGVLTPLVAVRVRGLDFAAVDLDGVFAAEVLGDPLACTFVECFTQWLVSRVAAVSAIAARAGITPERVAARQIRLTVFQWNFRPMYLYFPQGSFPAIRLPYKRSVP